MSRYSKGKKEHALSLMGQYSRTEARVIIEQWRLHYNQLRPHSSLGYRPPNEFRQHHDSLQPGAALSIN